jgi:diguanylate cyclase (GGDEF)-like protein
VTEGGGPVPRSAPRGSARKLHLGATARIWVLSGFLGLCALVLVLMGLPTETPVPAPWAIPWVLVALGVYVAEVKVIHLHIGGSAHSFSMSEIPVVAGLLFLAPAEFVVARVLGSAAALVINRRQSPVKLAFNLAQFTLTSIVMIDVVHLASLGPPDFGPVLWIAVLAAVLIENIVSVVAVSAAISLAEGSNQFRRVPEMLRIGAVVSLTNASLALLGVAIAWEHPSSALLIVIPALTAWLAYRAYVTERQQHQSIEMLYESTRILQSGPRIDAAIEAVLDHARRMFRAERAEIYIIARGQADEILRSSVGPGSLVETMTPIGRDFGDPALSRVATEHRSAMVRNPRAAETDRAGRYRNALIAPMQGEDGPIGLMVVADRLSEISPFDESDLQLFGLLANHTAVALENGQLEQSLTQLTELKEELRHQAFHDGLTGLANRALFGRLVEERLEHDAEVAPPSIPAILFIDLDDFKLVNDSMGHAAGDELLRSVGAMLTSTIRDTDVAARLGGDEFAVLVDDDPDLRHATRIADRLIATFERGIVVGGREMTVRASIGIAAGRPGTDRADDVMRNADVAMYSAKAHGKARVEIFEPTMQMAMMNRAQLSTDLQRAVAAREFVLEYQPIVHLETGRLIGVEALVRWDHPTRGRLAPDSFIRLAEESDTICSLGRWVLSEACRRAGEWSRMAGNSPFTISVNVSARELAVQDFVAATLETIAGYGLAPSAVVLEVTETAMLADPVETRARLLQLREAGVGVSIDDFGTGYSSLSYLRQFPVTALKIARDFVRADETEGQPWALANAIVAMGRALGLQVIAEGVETELQLTQLLRMGCEFAQGYYFARPLPVERVTALMATRAAGIGSVRDARRAPAGRPAREPLPVDRSAGESPAA